MKRMSATYNNKPARGAPMQWNVKEDEILLESDNEVLHNSDVDSETKHPISEEDDNYSQSLSPSRLSGSSAKHTDKDVHQREFPNSSDDQFTSRIDQGYKLIKPGGPERQQYSSLTSPSHIITKSSVAGHAPASLSKIKTKDQATKSMWDSAGNNVATSRSASAYSPYNASTSRAGASHKSPSVSSWKSLDAGDMRENLKKSSNMKKPTAKRNVTDPRLGGTPQKNLSPVLKAFSSDPFKDFQDAMVDIILDNDLKSLVDLEEFFDCYLQLTTPAYQDLVNQFFSDFCNELSLPESSLAQSTDD